MAGRWSRTRRTRLALGAAAIAVVVALAAIIAGSGGRRPDNAAVSTGSTGADQTLASNSPATTRVGTGRLAPSSAAVLPAGFSIRAGSAGPQASTTVPVVSGVALPPKTVAQILDRLPAWSPATGLASTFRWPAQTLTKPAAGKTTTQPFPAANDSQSPPAKPTQPPSGPLQVLRMQPQGTVSVAPFVSITFSQPMVAVGAVSTVGGLADAKVPATITPAVPGRWDWLGTTTLRFTADSTTVDRLPMATRFTVTVPAGTKAQGGGVLAKAATATFSTPPPTVQGFTPGPKVPVGLHPVMVAVFNQRVDPAAVLAHLTVVADGKPWPVRLATPRETAADQVAAAALGAAPQGRTVAFVAVRAFTPAMSIAVTMRSGTPSAEGPLTSAEDANFNFSTYPAMRLLNGSCSDSGCEPGGPIILTFANPIDPDAFDSKTVTVSPAIVGASITASGDQIVVSGATQPATNYRATVNAGLKDTFGQTLPASADATVSFGRAGTRIYPFPTSVSTLDPTATAPAVTVTTVNQKRFRERVFAVDLSDWAAYHNWYNKVLQTGNHAVGTDLGVPAWPVLVDRTVGVAGAGDQVLATTLDLGAQLTADRKQVVVLVQPIDPLTPDETWQNQPTVTWVQSTTLAVDAITDQSNLRTWVTDLRTSSPVPGVTVAMLDNKGEHLPPGIVTDARGLGAIDLTSTPGAALVATKGDQTALLPADMWGSWQRQPQGDQLLWYVNDDRQTYRPGETVSVKGWVRRQAGDTTMALTTPATGTVAWSATDDYGVRIGSGRAIVDRSGGFDLRPVIPAGAHLGSADLHLELAGAGQVNNVGNDHTFTIADYRTPAFQVETHSGTADPAIRGTDLPVQADATYYAGGPVGNAPVAWQVSTAAASYSPPGWSDYTFGVWTPWWSDSTGGAFSGGSAGFVSPGLDPNSDGTADQDSTVQTFNGTTDGNGSDYLAVKVGQLGKDTAGLPVTVTAQSTVTDVDRQQIAGTADILVHPAAYYVGLASDSTFVKQGERLTLQAIAAGIDGTAKAGRPITVTAGRVVDDGGVGQSAQAVSDPQTCTITSTATPVTCSFTPKVGGEYQITATVTDERGRTSRTQLTRWVAGADGSVATTVQEQSLTLVPDRKDYQPGQSAKLLVASPISTGTGLITLSHNGIVSTDTFQVSDGSAVVTVPISEASLPGVTASVEVVGSVPRSIDPAGGTGSRPAYATGQISLAVSTMSRSLLVTAKPRQSMVKPGGQTTVDVTVTDRAGKAVPGSQFEIIVVDEAVLALSGYQLPDPLDAFYPQNQQNWLSAVYGRSTVLLSTPSANAHGVPMASAAASSAAASGAAAAPAPDSTVPAGAAASIAPKRSPASSDAAGQQSATTPIVQRSAFAALALFRPTVSTDANGKAAVPVTLPDNLTRYRVMVVAVAGDTRFGTGESAITAGLSLTVRPSPPRFLNFGDQVELPIVVQNLTAAPRTTDVVLQAANLRVGSAGTTAGQAVTVPANGRVEVRFAVAAEQAGTARFRVAAVSGDDSDAAEQDFPVYTPSTSETFATYGSVPGNTVVSQPVSKPAGVIPAFGGLQISTSSTALAQLTDAVGYVADYDYQSSDALAAQVLAIASLGDVLQAFSAPGLPSPAQLKALVRADLGKLTAMQNSDGGFPYWQRGDTSDPFNSVQVVQALLVAEKYGYSGASGAAGSAAIKRALPYLRAVDAKLPADTSAQTRDTMNAYALSVRKLAGESVAAAADSMVARRGAALPLDAVAWLLPLTSAAPQQLLLNGLNNAAVDDAGSVTFTEAVTDDSWTVLQSDPRTDALILDALLTVEPKSDLIGKAVTGLMGQQQGGRWNNMQDNAFTLVALRHYYDVYEAATPDFVAAVWLGNIFAGQQQYSGHTTAQTVVNIPTSEVVKQGDTAITLADQGSGRMYYRIGLTTTPTSLAVAALDRGFVVTRTYAGADEPADVTRDAKGVWHIKAGARVRITDTMVSRSAQSHVALTDPLPAGLEALNPDLATTSKDLAGKNAAGGNTDPFTWSPTWYDHQDLLDDRAQAFAGWLQGGVYTYSYLASATTPGTFVVPPATAQQIYAPETFGRTATDRVVVQG